MVITSSERGFVPPTDASRMRDLLRQGGLTPAAAARELEIEVVRFRRYLAGKARPPRYVLLALERLVALEVRV
jgi:hypothetical protein